MWLLMGSSTAFIRAIFYESFLLLHICMAVVLVYSFFAYDYPPSHFKRSLTPCSHSSVFHGSFNGYLWPLIAIWSFDRFLRLARIVYCNIHIRFGGDFVKTPFTNVSYDSTGDVIRIDVQPGHCSLKPAPGQYYHIYQPFRLKGWENHPFSLGAYTTAPIPEASQESSSESNKEVNITSNSRRSSCSSRANSDGDMTLTFWVRPYDGWTRRIRDQCIAAQAPISPTLLLEGPYGHHAALHTFDTVVFLVGGTGISAALPYVLDHMARASRAPPRTLTKRIKLVWTSKQADFIKEMCRRELAGPLRSGGLEAEFYATRGDGAEDMPDTGIQHGRPEVRHVVREAASDANESGGRSVVFVCGPAAMADEARAAVHAEMKMGCRGIEYVEDCFGW